MDERTMEKEADVTCVSCEAVPGPAMAYFHCPKCLITNKVVMAKGSIVECFSCRTRYVVSSVLPFKLKHEAREGAGG